MILSICSQGNILSIMIIARAILNLFQIGAPIILIIMLSVDILKAVTGKDPGDISKKIAMVPKRLGAAALCYFVPTLIAFTMNVVAETFEYASCFTDATPDNLYIVRMNEADSKVAIAEKDVTRGALDEAQSALLKLTDETLIEGYNRRLDAVLAQVVAKEKANIKKTGKVVVLKENGEPDTIIRPGNGGNPSIPGSTGGLTFSGYYSNGTAQISAPGIPLTREPDPSAAINYWKSYINPNDFFYPADANGNSLGAWPKNYQSIVTQLSNPKVYHGTFIFPQTPENGIYEHVYLHNGIDIMNTVGTPIYSPVDGTVTYSEWGHTSNKGSDETAYSVGITPDVTTTVQGVPISNVFLTHMSGIAVRCGRDTGVPCTGYKVKKGQIVGFAGNAAGSSTSLGWAPHLHMTLYGSSYSNGLVTTKIEALYGIPAYNKNFKIVAGG